MSEKKLMVVFRFSVDVLNLLLLDVFSLWVFCGFKGLFFLGFWMGLSEFFKLSLGCFSRYFGGVVSSFPFEESLGSIVGVLGWENDKGGEKRWRRGRKDAKVRGFMSRVLRSVVSIYMGVCMLSNDGSIYMGVCM